MEKCLLGPPNAEDGVYSKQGKPNPTGKSIHIELTSKCVLRCCKCPRTIYAEELQVGEMPMDVFRKIFERRWFFVTLSGNHGDPIYHSRFHEILREFNAMKRRPKLYIETNGSHRSVDWWKETAGLLTERDSVCFSLDGLRDTNSIYRVNSDWDSILSAMTSLRDFSPAKLVWKYVLFRHNQHQVMDAFRLAAAFGASFKLIESSRFSINDAMEPTVKFAEISRKIDDHCQM